MGEHKLPKNGQQPFVGFDDLTLPATKDGRQQQLARILVTPNRFYIDVPEPALFRESVIMLSGNQEAAQHRMAVHQLLERWLTIGRGEQRQMPAAPEVANEERPS